ncbi:hypothetical protein F4821DRAFT_84741 [Hypoxylon rubiginosum]|uniref:Uncharacterized protein n=1 Tax=Hypoxylon rubiginosum TaxID=110542 RepID=A0ACC0D782_9PEZI|nr:hypothetical protein F4821DRAFT_84741 [Hypoxylon rubiginosum]
MHLRPAHGDTAYPPFLCYRTPSRRRRHDPLHLHSLVPSFAFSHDSLLIAGLPTKRCDAMKHYSDIYWSASPFQCVGKEFRSLLVFSHDIQGSSMNYLLGGRYRVFKLNSPGSFLMLAVISLVVLYIVGVLAVVIRGLVVRPMNLSQYHDALGDVASY